MRVTAFMGHEEILEARLSARERATLASAASILGQLRALRADADDDMTTDIALAAYVCRELAEASSVSVGNV